MKASLHTTLFFVIQADSMPEMPPETVTEEQYTDEHGHTVVKKVLSVLPLAAFFLSCKRKENHSRDARLSALKSRHLKSSKWKE